jgi:predicted DsbA family dithiol-disulfide isomerase
MKAENTYETNLITTYPNHIKQKKCVELYLFFDPFCSCCWGIQPIIKKLRVEYGQYLKISFVLTNKTLSPLCKKSMKLNQFTFMVERAAHPSDSQIDNKIWIENPIASPHIAPIAIKAAELQGKVAGIKFLYHLQMEHFLNKTNLQDIELLLQCAKRANLDVDEFRSDLQSEVAIRAYQSDFKITNELQVCEIPTMVFFSDNAEEDGVKISGLYPYDVYAQLLKDIIRENIQPQSPPPLEEYLQRKPLFSTAELSLVYSLTYSEVEHEMKKLMLQQKVKREKIDHATFWQVINPTNK